MPISRLAPRAAPDRRRAAVPSPRRHRRGAAAVPAAPPAGPAAPASLAAAANDVHEARPRARVGAALRASQTMRAQARAWLRRPPPGGWAAALAPLQPRPHASPKRNVQVLGVWSASLRVALVDGGGSAVNRRAALAATEALLRAGMAGLSPWRHPATLLQGSLELGQLRLAALAQR